jgi:uncharacterized protein (DUF488 family)
VRVFTVGHSNRDLRELVALLQGHGIETLVDVRAFPASRRWPHFSRERLAAAWPDYHWLGKELGGYRKPERPDSPHTTLEGMWQAYADHMESPGFREGIARLLELARQRPTTFLCAERLWHDCHRRHIADHLVAIEGVETLHIVDSGPPHPHLVDPRARLLGTRLVYDVGKQGDLF